MRVDHEKREIVCSVGDLVHESTYRRIGVERGDGFRRMWIGQDIHTKRAEQRTGEDANYRAEVHVVHRTQAGAWTVTITGTAVAHAALQKVRLLTPPTTSTMPEPGSRARL